MTAYDWSRFHIGLVIDAPRERVFTAWATAAGLESFFIKAAVHAAPDGTRRAPDEIARSGDRYRWSFVHEFTLEGEFVSIDEARARLTFTFGGPMTVTVRVEPNADGRALCVLTQEGIPTDEAERPFSHMNCRSCWIYFLMALKARLEHGIELRDLDPRTADAVSVHFASGFEGERATGRS